MQLSALAYALWVVTSLLEGSLCVLVLRRRLYRQFPLFTFYAFVLLTRTVLLWYLYYHSAFDSKIATFFAWTTRDLLIVARTAVCAEICRAILAGYRGVWLLAPKVLLVLAAAILAFTGLEAFSHISVIPGIIFALDRGLELVVAVVFLSSLVISARYRIPVDPGPRLVAIGLCSYSLFQVLNDSLLAFLRGWGSHFSWWNNVRAVSFQIALAVCIIALWKPWSEIAPASALVSQRIYEDLVARVSARLRQLDHYLREMTRL